MVNLLERRIRFSDHCPRLLGDSAASWWRDSVDMWHDPDDRLQKAIDRYEEGHVETARTMLRGLDRQGVISPRIDLYLGHCHLDADRPRAALRRYRRCLALSATDVGAWVGVALCHGRLGRLPRAVEALEHAASLDEEREEVHCHLVHCYALLGRLQDAERHALLAMRQDPSCPHVHRHLAIAYLIDGRPLHALEAWRRVAALDPTHPEVEVGFGRCLAALGRREEARMRYLQALEGEFAGDARAGLGDLAFSEGRLEDAAVQFRHAVLRDGDHTEARLRLAEVLGELGLFAEAWTHAEALQILWDPTSARGEDPWQGDPEVAEVAARLERAMGRRARGLRVLRRLVEAMPLSIDAVVRLGAYLLEAGRHGAAIRQLRRARRLARVGADGGGHGDIRAVRLLARALGRCGRRRESVKVLAQAAHRHPTSSDLQVDLAAALLAGARALPAERSLLRSIGQDAASAVLWAAAAEFAIDDGRRPRARRRLRAALRRDPRNGHALALLVRWHVEGGAWLRALHAARAAMRVLPVDHSVVKEYGRALLNLGRAGEAALPLRRYVLAAPGDPDGYRLLGRALEATGDACGARTQRRIGEVVGAGA